MQQCSPIAGTSSYDVITSPIAGTSVPLQGSEQLSGVEKCVHLLGNADLEFDGKNTSELSNSAIVEHVLVGFTYSDCGSQAVV